MGATDQEIREAVHHLRIRMDRFDGVESECHHSAKRDQLVERAISGDVPMDRFKRGGGRKSSADEYVSPLVSDGIAAKWTSSLPADRLVLIYPELHLVSCPSDLWDSDRPALAVGLVETIGALLAGFLAGINRKGLD